VLTCCQHRFCLDCLRALLEEAGAQQMIACPVCEQNIKTKDITAQVERAEKAESAAAAASSSSADNKRKQGMDAADMRSILSSAGGGVAPGSSSSSSSSAPSRGVADASDDVLSTAKLSWLRQELWRIKLAPGSAARDKVVLFSQWTSMLDVVEVLLDREQERAERDPDARAKGVSFNYARLDGSQSRAAQHTSLSRFSADDDSVSILLLSLSAGGTGLTLTAANHLVMLDLWWNPGLEAQAFDRVYRVGQTKAVFVHKLLVSGSVEEDLYELQQRKLQMAFGVMDAQRKGAAGSGTTTAGAASSSAPADSMSFKRKTAASGITLAELKNIFLAQPPARQPRY
jgi:SNF2 family DNA or RNA helicase